MKFPQLPIDKANHAIYGAVISFAVGAACHVGAIPYAALFGLAGAALFGVLKEGSDYIINKRSATPTHGVELMDFAATFGGGALVTAARFI